MKHLQKIAAILLLITLALGMFTSCELIAPDKNAEINITNGEEVEVKMHDTLSLVVTNENGKTVRPNWSASNDCVVVSINGTVTALKVGKVIVTAMYNGVSDSILVKVTPKDTTPPDTTPPDTTPPDTTPPDTTPPDTTPPDTTPPDTTPPDTTPPDTTPPDTTPPDDTDTDPYENVNKAAFYASYTPAKSYTDATFRTKHGLMSGSITVPDEAPTIATNRPTDGDKFILNTDMIYLDGGKTYVVVDDTGNEALRIYHGGAYITLEEVAAYVYAFGDIPPNYSSKKTPTNAMWSTWGEYLRANHSNFSGDIYRFPYEPRLPNISGCGGSLQYKELDIGTTGTTAGNYAVRVYNDGSRITRGAARIVYGKRDINGNGRYDYGELHLFYTYNHYNDFQEYLNYYGGWGEMFGNITGGGTLSSETHYNPTPYVDVSRASFSARSTAMAREHVILTFLGCYNKKQRLIHNSIS